MDIFVITAAITALSHASNVTKTLFEARDEVKRTTAVVELNGALADFQTKQLALIEDYRALLDSNKKLKEQLATYDKWEQEKSRYKRENVGAAAIVQSLDPAKACGDAPHWLCSHCFEDRKKGFFQRHGRGGNHYKCDNCGCEIDALKSYPKA